MNIKLKGVLKLLKYVKNCELCGKEFETNRESKIYCKKPHEMTCFHCNKKFELKKPRRGQKLYSCGDYKCRYELTKHVNMQKYGVENTSQLKGIQEKIKKTNLEKFGVEHAFQSDKVKEKIKETNLERYGTSNPRWENETSRIKAEKTNLERYGSENPFASDKIKESIKEKNVAKYGVPWSAEVPEVKEKMKSTFLERYGVDNPAKSEEIQEKIKKTNIEKYGEESHMLSEEGKEFFKSKIFEKYGVYNIAHIGITNYNDYLNLKDFLLETNMSITSLAEYFNLPRRRIRKRIIELGLQDQFKDLYVASVAEENFVDFLKNDEELKSIEYLRNDRKVLKGKELDFYFPEQKLAIEISPTSTHNSKVGFAGKGGGLPSTYHKNKFLECEKQGIELITIFDWHDWNKVMEMVKNKLKGTQITIYARKTNYVEYHKITPELFEKISSWHILSLPSNYKRSSDVGVLEHNGEIVGIALWKEDKEDLVELKRLVFKPGVSVPGGASKLIRNYHKERSLKQIYTFSDCDLGTGSVYKKVGFELIEESKPVLSYYSKKYDKHIRHLSLVRQGADRLLKDIPDYIPVGMGENLPSNKEIVESYGFLPIYDCGYRKWKLNLE